MGLVIAIHLIPAISEIGHKKPCLQAPGIGRGYGDKGIVRDPERQLRTTLARHKGVDIPVQAFNCAQHA
jgi:hypothetical protein